jgi:hypothetical protein
MGVEGGRRERERLSVMFLTMEAPLLKRGVVGSGLDWHVDGVQFGMNCQDHVDLVVDG